MYQAFLEREPLARAGVEHGVEGSEPGSNGRVRG
jgi:hypothetical protein